MKFRFLVRLIAFFRFIDINRNRKSCLSLRRHCLIELFLSVGFYRQAAWYGNNCLSQTSPRLSHDRATRSFTNARPIPVPIVLCLCNHLHRNAWTIRLLFSVSSVPGVGHVNLQGIFVRQCRPDAYLPALRCILRRIRQKIVHYLVELCRHRKTKDDIGSTFKRKEAGVSCQAKV